MYTFNIVLIVGYFNPAVIMLQNLLITAAPSCHLMSPYLTHADTMSESPGLHGDGILSKDKGDVCGIKPVQETKLSCLKLLSSHGDSPDSPAVGISVDFYLRSQIIGISLMPYLDLHFGKLLVCQSYTSLKHRAVFLPNAFHRGIIGQGVGETSLTSSVLRCWWNDRKPQLPFLVSHDLPFGFLNCLLNPLEITLKILPQFLRICS